MTPTLPTNNRLFNYKTYSPRTKVCPDNIIKTVNVSAPYLFRTGVGQSSSVTWGHLVHR